MKKKSEYYNIYSEFYKENDYRKLKNVVHHGDNRLSHINRVGKMTFYLSKVLRLDYVSSTRGALMHDFFLVDDDSDKGSFKNHPTIALETSRKHFKLNDIEEDIIVKHMFPATLERPKYKESTLVCICDKVVSLYELLRFKISLQVNIIVVFIINSLYS